MVNLVTRWVGVLALLVVAGTASVAQSQVYTFREVAPSQYDFLINGMVFRRLDYRSSVLQRFSITEDDRVAAGLPPVTATQSGIMEQANSDLQNNIFLSRGTTMRVSLSEEFVRGTVNQYAPRVPRAVFDFQQVRRNQFRLYINGNASLWINLNKVSSKTIFISKKSLRSFGISDSDMMAVLDRHFGNNQAMTSDGFNIFLTRDRAKGSGDTLFYFQQERPNGFRFFINGREAGWLNLRDFAGDPVFTISKTSLAARFGLVGSVADVIESLRQNGVDIEMISDNLFQFTVDRQLFLNGGQRNVEDTIFLVRRDRASVS